MIDNFDEAGRKSISRAVSESSSMGHGYVGPEHLLIAVSPYLGGKYKPLAQQFSQQLRIVAGKGSRNDNRPAFTEAAKAALSRAAAEARARGYTSFPAAAIAFGVLQPLAERRPRTEADGNANLARMFSSMGVEPSRLRQEVAGMLDRGAAAVSGSGSAPDHKPAPASGARRRSVPPSSEHPAQESAAPEDAGPTNAAAESALEKYAVNLTSEARADELDPVIGRDTEISHMERVLGRRSKNNPVIVGEAGVGKTAIVEGLADRIARGGAPSRLEGCEIYSLDVSGLVAGAKYRGEFEERLSEIVAAAMADPGMILFVDEIHSLVGAGSGEGSMDAASILKVPLARGKLRLIGATTQDEYRRYIEKDAALERRFQKIQAEEPSREIAMEVLAGLKGRYERHHAVGIPPEAIEEAVRLSERYITDRRLPDKAIDVIDEAASAVAGANANSRARAEPVGEGDGEGHPESGLRVSTDDVCAVVSAWTGIPVGKLSGEQAGVLRNLESILSERIVGQKEAIAAVAPCVRRALAGMADPKRPTGSFLFLGPTGVGKTELARALAGQLFATEDAFIKVDMSEYMERHTTSRLIGSPPGYIGHESPGFLTEKVRRYPYSIVLFDEIEKAHDEVANLLLQILEDGKLTDAQGKEVDFTNTVVIMTSNIGAGELMQTRRKTMGFSSGDKRSSVGPEGSEKDKDDTTARVLASLKAAMKPEIIGRIDETVVFEKLSAVELRQIAALQARQVSERLCERGVSLAFSEHAIAALSELSGDEGAYGARPIRKRIRRFVEQPMGDVVLGGGLMAGETACVLDRAAFEYLCGPRASVNEMPRLFYATGGESPVLIAAASLENRESEGAAGTLPGVGCVKLEEAVLAELCYAGVAADDEAPEAVEDAFLSSGDEAHGSAPTQRPGRSRSRRGSPSGPATAARKGSPAGRGTSGASADVEECGASEDEGAGNEDSRSREPEVGGDDPRPGRARTRPRKDKD